MTTDIGVAMTDDEMDELLAAHNNGVLSMGVDDTGYGIPMSYEYDADNDRLIFGFVDGPNSKKRRYRDRTDAVSFTVYEYEDVDEWASVIVDGTLHALEDTALPEAVAPVFYRRIDAANDGPNWVDIDALDRQVYELRITGRTGRHSGTKR